MLQSENHSDLKSRLDRMSERLAEARAQVAHPGPEFESGLSGFARQHDFVRSLINASTSKDSILMACLEMQSLEQFFDAWLKSVDKQYARPRPRGPNVSM